MKLLQSIQLKTQAKGIERAKSALLRGSGLWLGLNVVSLGIAVASTFYARPFPETVAEAPMILKGRIGSHYVDWGKGDNAQRLYTWYEFQNEETLKGQGPTRPSALIREMGGEKDGVGFHVEGASEFQSGEHVVIMTKSLNSEGSFDIHGMMLGKLNIETDSNGNEVLRGPALWGEQAGPNQLPKRWTVADLRRLVRQQASLVQPSSGNRAVAQTAPEPARPSPKAINPSLPAQPKAQLKGDEDENMRSRVPALVILIGISAVLVYLWKFLK